MPFELNPKHPIGEDVQDLMDGQIARIEAHLRSSAAIEDRVHDVRKRTKETRALLRLVRSALGSQFRIENLWYRDAARELAPARNAAALVESVKKLRKHATDRAALRALRHVERVLKHIRVDGAQLESRIASLLEHLADARARLKKWPQLADRFSTIGEGLQRTFGDGRRALREVTNDPTAETFHELRKRVKDHWYHGQLLRRVWPEFMTRYAEVVEEVSDALGDHHDLIVLRETLREDPTAYGDQNALETTFAVIQKRRTQLEKKSMRLSSEIYAEGPPQFRDRLRAYWQVARG